MTRFSFKRTAVAGALALTTIGATLGVAGAQALPAGTTDYAVQQQQPGGPGQPGRPGRGEGNGEQRPQLTEEQRQQFEQQREAAQQRYIDALAKNLGLDSSTVKAALEQTQKDMQAARISEIQQAVADGKLTQEQADAMIQRIQQGGPGGPGFGMGGPGGPEGGRGPGGPGGPQGGR
jgi:Spy/CpxP family protein refolding chaperone